MNDFRNFNEIFRKDVTYDNIKSYKKPEPHPLFKPSLKETFLEKRQGVQVDAPPSLFRVKNKQQKSVK